MKGFTYPIHTNFGLRYTDGLYAYILRMSVSTSMYRIANPT